MLGITVIERCDEFAKDNMGYDMEMEDYHEDIELKKKLKEELQKLIDEINEEAKNIVEDYSKNPSEMSGSIIQIHETSPILNEKKDKDEI